MIIIGERINATRKAIKAAVGDHDENLIVQQVRSQDEAGAHYIDLNAGTGSGDPEQEASDLVFHLLVLLRLRGLSLEDLLAKLADRRR